jgi:DNA-binding CsgD family transcriptional regulator
MAEAHNYVLAMIGARARTQTEVIRDVMLSAAECARSREGASGGWLTLGEIAELTAFSEASVSAQLRNLRKPKYGGYVVEKRRRRCLGGAQWEYRMSGRQEFVHMTEMFGGAFDFSISH